MHMAAEIMERYRKGELRFGAVKKHLRDETLKMATEALSEIFSAVEEALLEQKPSRPGGPRGFERAG